ncbi:MAG: tetratricopeptide repeat protein [Bacteroidaceae bacterium]|nr:tetratricopeptide repeat protein [Bacteroidaceae bacterium]MBQ2292141.1 tetratricopeptide repeat protein [Bacteroidaceae bacterium]MBQ2301323.1 tetratricopeptide repeat protein [Bacteroidaceae bacterium]MBQ5714072.1 tetratricopeptide repeat protein [Bacteroidaceae bacterium]
MKKLTLFVCLAMAAAGATAQNFEGSTLEERIAHTMGNNEDSIKTAKGFITMFQQSNSNKDYKDMYVNYQWLKKNAPFAVNGIYTQGPFMFYNLINTEQDPAKKKQYFDEMMELFELRQKNLDALNSFAKTKSTLGDVLSVKAEYYNWTAPGVFGQTFDLRKSYANFSEAIKMVNEHGGREITGSFLQTFFLVSDAIYKAMPNTTREQYLQDYLDSKDACEKMLQLAKDAKAEGDTARAQKLLATYDAPLAQIEYTFAQSGAADSTQLVNIYTKKFESYKQDINKLNSSLTIMQQNDCDKSDIYYQYAEAAYALQPSFTSAIGLAQKSQKDGQLDKMLEYYEKALELASNDARRGVICLNICNGLTKSQQYTGALTYAEKAIAYDADLTGKAYLKEANIYTMLGQYDEAIAYCGKASDADITVSGSADRLKANIKKVQANQAANAAARKAYDDYIARQKEEEAFWSGSLKK